MLLCKKNPEKKRTKNGKEREKKRERTEKSGKKTPQCILTLCDPICYSGCFSSFVS